MRATHCPHGVKVDENPAVMPDCEKCMDHSAQVYQLIHSEAIFRPFPHYPGVEYPGPKPKLPAWMQH